MLMQNFRWAKAHDLIIAAKISKNDLEKLITTANIILRYEIHLNFEIK